MDPGCSAPNTDTNIQCYISHSHPGSWYLLLLCFLLLLLLMLWRLKCIRDLRYVLCQWWMCAENGISIRSFTPWKVPEPRCRTDAACRGLCDTLHISPRHSVICPCWYSVFRKSWRGLSLPRCFLWLTYFIKQTLICQGLESLSSVSCLLCGNSTRTPHPRVTIWWKLWK